jgi:hypothetical protein
MKALVDFVLRKTSARAFRDRYIADVPVDLARIAEYRAEAFPQSGPACWLDRPDALLRIDEKVRAGDISDAQADCCRQWVTEGYVIAKNLIDFDLLDRTWEAYEHAISSGVISVADESHGDGDPFPGRKLDPHIELPEVRALMHHQAILGITDIVFGRRTLPFQTIMGHKGSGQAAHSDAIHMTTYPIGYLAAAWVAFEDVHPDSGPLFFYPRSHRLLPYLLSADVGIAPVEYKANGPSAYSSKYEPAVQRYLDAYKLEKHVFEARKGDVLLWHSNLVHGGARRIDLQRSRKALVCHYLADGVFSYHDLSGNPTRLHRRGLYNAPELD